MRQRDPRTWGDHGTRPPTGLGHREPWAEAGGGWVTGTRPPWLRGTETPGLEVVTGSRPPGLGTQRPPGRAGPGRGGGAGRSVPVARRRAAPEGVGRGAPLRARAPPVVHLPTSLCASAANMAALSSGGAPWRRGEGLLTGAGCLHGARAGEGGRACGPACPYLGPPPRSRLLSRSPPGEPGAWRRP